MQLCAAYYRVSTARQKENQTIDAQKSRAAVDLKARGLSLVREYEDDGESATTLHNRIGMLNLLADAELGIFDCVWVMDLDRFDRSSSSIEWALIKGTLRKHSIKVVTPTQVVDLENEDQEFMADLLNKFAALELRKIQRRMANGKWAKAREGLWTGGNVPFGYYADEVHNYQIDPEQSRVYENMVEWAEGGLPTRKIAARLESLGVKTSVGGTSWSSSSVYTILSNSLYTGVYRRFNKHYKGGKKGKAAAEELHVTTNIPPLITHERWMRLKEDMATRRTMSEKNAKRPYLLSRLIYCAECHCRMTGEYRSKGSTRLYSCAKHRMGVTVCPSPYRNADEVETVVWGAVVRRIKNAAHFRKHTEATLHVKPSKPISNLIAQLDGKEREEERLVDLFLSAGLDKPAFEKRRKNILAQKKLLQDNIAEINQQRKVQDTLSNFNGIVQILTQYAGALLEMPQESKRKVLECLFYGSEGVGVYQHADGQVELVPALPLPEAR